MEESVTYQEIKDEGRAEGRLEGRIQEARDTILFLGRVKFGEPPPAEARTLVEGIRDHARLKQLQARLLTVDSWQAFLAQTWTGRSADGSLAGPAHPLDALRVKTQ